MIIDLIVVGLLAYIAITLGKVARRLRNGPVWTTGSFTTINTKLDTIINQEGTQMALGQDILDAVTAETTKINSFIALVQGLINDNTIPADVGAAILAKVKEGGDALDVAIAANTTP